MARRTYGVQNEAGEVVADDPLSFTWSVPKAALAAAGVEPSGYRKRDIVLASILAAAYNGHMTGDTGWVSFSLRKAFYENPLRYRETLYTLDNIRGVVEHAEAEGWLEVHWAQSGDNFRKLGQSRFRALPRLIDAFAGVEFECRDDKPSVIFKDEDGHRLNVDVPPDMSARIDRINAAFAQVEFTLPPECERIDPHHVRCPVDLSKPRKRKRKAKGADEPDQPRQTHHIVRTEKRIKIRRVFNGSWELGGRAFWYGQSLRKVHRERSLLDGDETAEPDFKSMHPRMLYAREVLSMPEEAYKYPRADKGYKEVWPKGPSKTAWVVGINADRPSHTILKIMDEHDMSWPDAEALYHDMERHHAPIAHHLCSGVGLSLMRDDSEICLEVVEECLARGIIALPIHDSFICKKRHKEEVEEIMEAAMQRYERRCAEARAAMIDESIPIDIEPPAVEEAAPAIEEIRPILVPAAVVDSSPHKLFGRAPLRAGAGGLPTSGVSVCGFPVGRIPDWAADLPAWQSIHASLSADPGSVPRQHILRTLGESGLVLLGEEPADPWDMQDSGWRLESERRRALAYLDSLSRTSRPKPRKAKAQRSDRRPVPDRPFPPFDSVAAKVVALFPGSRLLAA